jgi:hypothetical protein
MLLGTVSPADLVVAYGSAGGSDLGGNQLLYRVDATGHATQYGKASLSAPPTSSQTIFGALQDFAADQTGTQLGFATYSRGGPYSMTISHGAAAATVPAVTNFAWAPSSS